MVKKSSNSSIRGVFWYRNDLRLHDLPALDKLCKHVDELAFVYVLPGSQGYRNVTDVLSRKNVALSEERQRFLAESLSDLNHSLSAHGHSLTVLDGDLLEAMVSFCTRHHISYLGVSQHSGLNERQQLSKLGDALVHTKIISGEGHALFNEVDLPFSIEAMPQTFSPFRRKIEKKRERTDDLLAPSPTITFLPPPFSTITSTLPFVEKSSGSMFTGGESAGLKHLAWYFKQNRFASEYKVTRNALDTWEHSTKLSPWLAHGCVSPKAMLNALLSFEDDIEKNNSTYWIYFELLWRDFFYHLQKRFDGEWFQRTGINGNVPTTRFNNLDFERWCNGETGYDIVDACMKQLSATGFMSNRGRQLVASCFVHELALDWRFGASWFEHCLIDYEVASNWGNWQYLAGVGCDPRGHRQFNLEKQTQMYDPNGEFRNAWLT